jgi:hypothetical protein
MAFEYKRHYKNYLINKNFQVNFFLRFFIFSFLILTVGTALQYRYANQTIMENISTLSGIVNVRQENLITFLNNTEFNKLNAAGKAVTPKSSQANKLLKEYTQFIEKEVLFMRSHMKKSREILHSRLRETLSSFFVSFLIVGVFLNFVMSSVYGLFLSHNIAGNHYRLQQFAKQLQKRDLVEPLMVRKKDFFRETADEFDKVRKTFQDDLVAISKEQTSEVVKKYTLEKS